MQHVIIILCIVLLAGLPAHSAEESVAAQRKSLRPIATEPFLIPDTPPNMTITASSMQFASGVVVLEGNVRAVRDPDRACSERSHFRKSARRAR